jgi:hypothetical protein
LSPQLLSPRVSALRWQRRPPGRPQDANDKEKAGVETAGLANLSDKEIEGILLMREEEKLAWDVYQALFDMWGQPVFQSIANNKQAHVDAVKGLIDPYGLDDPVGGRLDASNQLVTPPNVFARQEAPALSLKKWTSSRRQSTPTGSPG